VIEPVKEEWIVGKALFSVPLVGYLPLHILEVTIVIVCLMVIHELYLRSRQENQGKQPKKGGKKQR
jgi:signal peptidase